MEMKFAGLVPMLPVTDVPRAIAFYEKLGFTVGNSHAPGTDDAPTWAWLYNGKAHIMINQSDHRIDASHASTGIWVYVDDVSGTHDFMKTRGVDPSEISYPFYNPGGEFHVHDPDGYAIFFAHAE